MLASVAVPVISCEAKCCGRRVVVRKYVSCGAAKGGQIKIGGCRRYSWVSETPSWKGLPEDFHMLPREEQKLFKEAFELVPKKIRKQAEKSFKQRAEYLKRPNAVKDRETLVAKLAKRSAAKRKSLPDEYVLKMYDEMLVYGRSLTFGDMEYDLLWLAERYGFTNVTKFIKKVNSTSEKKGRDWKYPTCDSEFEAFEKLAQKGSDEQWCRFKFRLLRINQNFTHQKKSKGQRKS